MQLAMPKEVQLFVPLVVLLVEMLMNCCIGDAVGNVKGGGVG